MQNSRRIVVTGLGMVTPLGNDVKTTWQNILDGKSGIDHIESFVSKCGADLDKYKVRFAGRIKDFDVSKCGNKVAKKLDKFVQYGLAAVSEAMEDAGLGKLEGEESHRSGVSIGAGIGGITILEEAKNRLESRGPTRVSPFTIPASIINMLPGVASINYNLRGPNFSVVTACSTGTHNIGIAARMIANGEADLMIAGGSEHASTPVGMSGFASSRALSTRNDEPKKASRPWDKDRDGFVLSDGAGILVLEEYEKAKARGAKIYAELIGFGMSGDAYHMTMPSSDGQKRCIINALRDAGILDNPGVIDYVNAHGTSTVLGDVEESKNVEAVVGVHNKDLVMSSTKSMTGHLLGAAGAIESIFSILSIRDQIAPPTINLDNIAEGCNLDYAANKAKPMKINYVLNNSFGFGGTNGSIIFKKLED